MPASLSNNGKLSIKRIDSETTPLVSCEVLESTDSLDSIPLVKEKEYLINVLCDHSIKVPNRGFTNFVGSRASNVFSSKINKTISLHCRKMKEKELPFYDKYENLRTTTINTLERFNDILLKYINIPLQEDDEQIVKVCWYKDLASGLDFKTKNNWIRVLYRLSDDDEKIEIVLIDPNHLFAIDDYDNQYKKYKDYQIDIKSLYEDYCNLRN